MSYIWKSDLGPEKLPEFEHIKRMITLSVITLSSFHCIRRSKNLFVFLKVTYDGKFLYHPKLKERALQIEGGDQVDLFQHFGLKSPPRINRIEYNKPVVSKLYLFQEHYFFPFLMLQSSTKEIFSNLIELLQ